MPTHSVSFYSAGSRLDGELLVPDDYQEGERRPAICLCHGYSGIRQLILPEYSQKFLDAGFVAFIWDYRGFGTSEGEKWRVMPLEQVEDIRNAISFLAARPEVDPENIGLWGTSYGGAHAPYVMAIDERLKAAVGQVGFTDGTRLLLETRTPDEQKELLETIASERVRRVRGEGEQKREDTASVLASPQTKAFFEATLPEMPELYCELTWESAEKTMEYKPIEMADRIAPRKILLIGAIHDDLCKYDHYERFAEAAGDACELVGVDCSHYEIYAGEPFEESAKHAVEFFSRTLAGAKAAA